MTVEPIPVIRAAYLELFMDATDQCTSKDMASLLQFNLPANLANKPDAYVPLQTALSFAQWAAQGADIEAFGIKVGSRLQVSNFSAGLRSALQGAASLERALECFARLADREQSNVHYRIERTGDEVQICSSLDAAPPSDNKYPGEWLRIMSLMTVIRYFTGNEWMPSAIALQSQREPGQHARRAFPRTRFLTGQAETGIIIPASLLSLATTRNYPLHKKAGAPGTESAATGPAWDFPASLQEIVQTYLEDGYPDITLAANVIGCSVRTLQRRLKAFGLSYTDVVQQARFSLATDLLSDPDTKVIDAALAVGYEDPSHFARAFRRLAGISPNQYRRLNYAL